MQTAGIRPGEHRGRISRYLLLALAVVVACSGPEAFNEDEAGGLESAPTSTVVASNSVPTVQAARSPVDGRPEELGVASIDFITALFPTSPEEHRIAAAWSALRYNIENGWVEACMAARGFFLEVPRELAENWRRNADMPDFELDARLGTLVYSADPSWEPKPPASASPAEAEAWDHSYMECSLEVEKKRSEEFDQVMGKLPFWWDIVREVNGSEPMSAVTAALLGCVADGGGPEVDRIYDIYLSLDAEVLSSDTKDEAIQEGLTLAEVIYECAGDYDAKRQALLIPKRDEIVDSYREVLAEAERYFAEVMSKAYGE